MERTHLEFDRYFEVVMESTDTVGCKYVEIFATPGVANSSVMSQPTV